MGRGAQRRPFQLQRPAICSVRAPCVKSGGVIAADRPGGEPLAEVAAIAIAVAAGHGGVSSQPLTGGLVARTGSRPATTVLLLVFLATFVAPIVAWSTPVFFLATFLLGVTAGAANVAINTQASEIERARGRPTMSSFHGFFSLGALAGAALGGGVVAIGWQ